MKENGMKNFYVGRRQTEFQSSALRYKSLIGKLQGSLGMGKEMNSSTRL
jgi:hypothetical protein